MARKITLLIIACALSVASFANMSQMKQEGAACAKGLLDFSITQAEQFSSDVLKPDNSNTQQSFYEESVTFLNSNELKQNLQNHHFSEEEHFFKNSEDILNGNVALPPEEHEEYTYETCQESGDAYPLSLTRSLQVDVQYTAEEKREARICLGHQEEARFYWKKDAEKWVKKHKKQLSQDSSIGSHSVYITEGSLTSSYIAQATWIHQADAPTCTHHKTNITVITPQQWQEFDEHWVYDNDTLLNQSRGPDCSLIETLCLDAKPRNIHGKEVSKKCWKESLHFLCRFPKTSACIFLRDKNCIETGRKCLQESPAGCALWEISYQCLTKAIKSHQGQQDQHPFGLDTEISYEPNKSFSDVYTKMALFEDLKKELESQNVSDATKIQLFKGKSMECSKNVADHLIYDCCFSYSGLATKMKLSQCSEEELSLGSMREKGLCHYIGKYGDTFLDLWKSKDVHVFCCFPTRLSRVFQEEARKQLNLSWGNPESPNCRGFLSNEMANLDFSKINLSEVYDQPQDLQKRLEEKLNSVQPKLQERLQQEQHNATI